MIKITRFFYINILCIPLFILAYFTNSLTTLLVAYCVAAVHEMFHLFAALFLSVRVKSVIIMPFGITLRLKGSIIKNTAKEVAISFAGPFANLLMIATSYVLWQMNLWGGASLFLFVYLNLIMFAVNMLPCMPLDGGRILRALLVEKAGYINAVSFQKKIERFIVIILTVLGIVLIFITKFNISLIIVAAFLTFNMVGEENFKNYVVMNEIMMCGDKLKNRKYMMSKSVAARNDIKALDILKRVGYDSFYIIHVIDKDLRIKKSITESQVIDAINKNGAAVTLNEIT